MGRCSVARTTTHTHHVQMYRIYNILINHRPSWTLIRREPDAYCVHTKTPSSSLQCSLTHSVLLALCHLCVCFNSTIVVHGCRCLMLYCYLVKLACACSCFVCSSIYVIFLFFLLYSSRILSFAHFERLLCAGSRGSSSEYALAEQTDSKRRMHDRW